MNQAKQSVSLTVKDALKHAGLQDTHLSETYLAMGLTGLNNDKVRKAVLQWDLPCQSIFATSNLHIANFAAHGADNGAVIVIGTDTHGFTLVGGKELKIGGHGFPMGDKGSSAWLGFAAVQAALQTLDGLSPPTQLTFLLERHLKVSSIHLAAHLNSAKESDYANLAPLVFQAADNADLVANSILEEGVSYLTSIAKKLINTGAKRLSIIGDLSQKMLPYFTPHIQASCSPALHPPEIGAAMLAREQYFVQQEEKNSLRSLPL